MLCTSRGRTRSVRRRSRLPHARADFYGQPAGLRCRARIDGPARAPATWRQRVERVHAGLRQGLSPARSLPGVSDVRVLGAIGVIQLDHQVDVAAATDAAVERGVWVRPFRDLIYTMPAYVTPDADLATIGAALCAAAEVG